MRINDEKLVGINNNDVGNLAEEDKNVFSDDSAVSEELADDNELAELTGVMPNNGNNQQTNSGTENNLRRQHHQPHQAMDNSTENPIPAQDNIEVVVRNFVRRLAMILQAEKAIIMLYTPEASRLVAQSPAVGFDDETTKSFSYSVDTGVSGEVFKTGEPQIVNDIPSCMNANLDFVKKAGMRNVLIAPLIIERRANVETNPEQTVIGVVLVINKKFNKKFTKEDENLLTVLARNSSALIGNALKYTMLKRESSRLASTFDSMQTGIIVLDVAFNKIISVNDAAANIIGFGKSKLLNKMVKNLTLEDSVAYIFETAFSGDENFLEATIDDKVYRVDIGTNGSRETEKIIILTDITDLKNVENMKTNFVSTVSHELRTPLTVIKGFISTLLDDPDGEYYDSQSRLEFYNIIDTECDRLVRLISDLLSISRIERGLSLQLNYTSFNAIELIEKCILFHKNYTDNHNLIFETIYEQFNIEADKDKIDQVVTNLISNALKYSPEGGDILVSFDVNDDYIKISVKDHGLGIAPDHINKIFECFHRVDNSDSRKIGGTGIGLFLVDSIVKEHNGTINVESELGVGSTFIVNIPIHRVDV